MSSKSSTPSLWLALAAMVSAVVVLVAPPTQQAHAATAGTASPRSNVVLEKRVIGRSVKGRPIVAYRKGNPDAARTVVVLGGMHGDESAGKRTALFMLRHVGISADADVWIIPTMNPDGLARGTRTNAHGVDLNRNWPRNWSRGGRGRYYPGPRAASEPETRAMMRFLDEVQPEFLTSIHQPFATVGLARDKPRAFQRRLARNLGLPLRSIGISRSGKAGRGAGDPTLTSWYNARHAGTAITVEYSAHPSRRYVNRRAGYGILRASLAR